MRLIFKRLLVSIFSSMIALESLALADSSKQTFDLTGFNDVIHSGFEQLELQTKQLHQDTVAYCGKSSVSLGDLQSSYKRALNAWGYVQVYNWGPSIEEDLFPSLYYWPDKKNITGRQLNLVLNQEAPDLLDHDSFSTASIALTGFNTLEQLLFDKELITSSTYACELTEALTASIVSRVTRLNSAWSSQLSRAQPNEVLTMAQVIEGVNEALLTAHQRKLNMVIGDRFEDRRPRLGEAWRSRESLNLIHQNVNAIRDVLTTRRDNAPSILDQIEAVDSEVAMDIVYQLTSLDRLLSTTSGSLYDSIDQPSYWRRLRLLEGSLQALQLTIAGSLSQALGITFGFSSSDGD